MQYGSSQETFLLQLLAGSQLGGATTWLSIAYLLCLFGTIIFKPERVRSLSMFRRACVLFAISLIAPSLVSICANVMTSQFGASGMPRGVVNGLSDVTPLLYILYQFLSAIGPLLLGISVLCAFISIVPSFIPTPDDEPFSASPGVRPFRPPIGTPPTS